MSASKSNIMAAIVFMAIGLVSGFISDMLLSVIGWEAGLLTTFVTFGIFFILLVYFEKAKMGMGPLFIFAIIGFVSSYLSGFLGDMWGITGSVGGSLFSFLVFFIALALIGTERTGVTTTTG